MASVAEHYDQHLGPIYTWMSGGADAARARFTALLTQLDLRPRAVGATAVDLGCGSGFQTIPLAQAGYQVTAIDFSEALLTELARDTDNLAVRTVRADLRELERYCPTPSPEVIVCMGDTLPHLPSIDDIARVLASACQALAPNGHLLLSFRDYTVPRSGNDRFIPVRGDTDRILTCFLEYENDHVTVHDVLHTRSGNEWRLNVSAYRKTRLAPEWVRRELTKLGLELVYETAQSGTVTLAARRSHF